MLKHHIFLLVAISMAISFFTGCGRIIEQNEVCLVLRAAGNREAKAINKKEVSKKKGKIFKDTSKNELNNFEAEMITATRAPIERAWVKILVFPLGNQIYRFTAHESFESPENEAMKVDARGGEVSFDYVIHCHIDRNYSDLKNRLVKFMQDYQLREYSGSDDVLAKLMADRLNQVIRKQFIDYSAPKMAISLMTGKTGINYYVLTNLNERFNKYGLVFTLAGVSSAMTIPGAQQKRLDKIVKQSFSRQALTLQNDSIAPLQSQIAVYREKAITARDSIMNAASSYKIEAIAKAQKGRRTTFVRMLGKKSYVTLETMLTKVRTLENAKTEITILPKDAKLVLGNVIEMGN